ncbi:MAG: glycosyltransferase [Sumerlaeia bacterium]
MDQPPAITVVIPVRNGRRTLEKALQALRLQTWPAERLDVLVVDNGSTDGSGDLARSLGARVVECPEPGVARARDLGWRSAQTPLVAFLDCDCEPPEGWLDRAAEALLAGEKTGAVGVRLVPGEGRTLAEEHIIRSGFLDTDFFAQKHAISHPFLVTAGIVLRREALEAVDGFDLSFGRATGEDADLCWRLEDAGWACHYLPEIEVVHHHRATLRAMLNQVYWYGWGTAEVFARHRRRFGFGWFYDPTPYRRLVRGVVRAPLAWLRSDRSRYERLAPGLEALDASAFLLGKARGAVRNRIVFF